MRVTRRISIDCRRCRREEEVLSAGKWFHLKDCCSASVCWGVHEKGFIGLLFTTADRKEPPKCLGVRWSLRRVLFTRGWDAAGPLPAAVGSCYGATDSGWHQNPIIVFADEACGTTSGIKLHEFLGFPMGKGASTHHALLEWFFRVHPKPFSMSYILEKVHNFSSGSIHHVFHRTLPSDIRD